MRLVPRGLWRVIWFPLVMMVLYIPVRLRVFGVMMGRVSHGLASSLRG